MSTVAESRTGGALAHLRVLDISQVRAGPTCVRQFADFGADVLKIEPPDTAGRQELYVGARDGADMQNLHRNKRSMTLDLRNPEGRRIFLQLVVDADIVVENFRPDVKRRLGIAYEALAEVNPRIILVSMSGFGEGGPYHDRPGYDQIVQGMCGLMSATGFPDGPPTRAGAAVVDMVTGLYAALGAFTALAERSVSGRGQWVQTSLLHSGIALMDFQAARCAIDGDVPLRMGNDHPTSMPTSAYPTSDGYINVGAGGDVQWRSLCGALGMPALADREEFRSDRGRATHRAELNRLLGERFRTASTEHWLATLAQADVPAGPIYSMDQVVTDPQVQALGMFATVQHPKRGALPLVAQPVRLQRTPPSLREPLESKGGSTDGVLRGLGYGDADIRALRAAQVIG